MAVICLFGLTACGGGGMLTKSDYLEVFNSVISTVDNYGTTPQTFRTSLNDEDFTAIEDQSQGKRVLQGNTAMLYFLRNLCNTDGFEIKDDYMDMIVNDNSSNPNKLQVFKIRLKMSYKDNSIINAITYVEDHTKETVSLYFLEFEFDYNFDTKTLNGFSVLGVMGNKNSLTKNDVNYLKYYNNTLKVVNPTAPNFNSFANDVLNETVQHGQNPFADNLTDYSTQYITAMQNAYAS